MTFTVTFSVDGIPHGKGRPRFKRMGNFVQTYTDAKTKTYEALVKEAAKKAMGSNEPLETPISFYCHIRLPVPKSFSKKLSEACLSGFIRPTKRSDIDNYCKSVMDALNGVVYVDDSQVVHMVASKAYAAEGGIDVVVAEKLL
jgi:Holliday junction resolvase RusA-like endonuclease